MAKRQYSFEPIFNTKIWISTDFVHKYSKKIVFQSIKIGSSYFYWGVLWNQIEI